MACNSAKGNREGIKEGGHKLRGVLASGLFSIGICILLTASSICFGAPLTYSPQQVSLAASPGHSTNADIAVTSPATNVDVQGPQVTSVAPNQPIPASWVSCSPGSFTFKKNQLTKSFNFHFDIPAGQAAGVYVSRVGVHVVSDGGQGVTDGSGVLVTLRVKGPPVASFSFAPTSPVAGQSVQFTDSSSDPDNAIVSWRWTFGDGATSSAQNPSHAYSAPGTYTVTLTVTDGDGLTDSESKQIQVTAVPPTASFSFSPSAPLEGQTVSFTDTSSAGSYPIASWSWNFGDGATSSQQNPTHAYSDNGAYTVRLTVVDSGGQSASASLQVTVQNVPPTAEAGPGRSCNVGETLSFSASFTDPGSADTHTFSWNFGDGSTATGHDVSHAYTAAGEYTLTLTVTDDDGGVGSDTARITVTAVPPTASFSFSPSAPLEGQTVSFTDTSSAGSYPIVSWSWNFGDGASSSQQNPTHAYSDNGAYTVSLSVADSIGASGSSSLPLVVTNAAPVVDAGPDRFARVGELISFSATIQDPGVLDSHTVAWDFGDGRGARGSTVQHGYSSPGAYTVTVTATDDEGAVGQDSLGVQVVAASGRTEEGRTQAAPTILLQAEYSGPSFASTDSSLSLSYLVQSADAGWGGAANVEGAQVVFQVWSVPSLSRTEIAASASADGRAAADVQLPAGTYLVSTGVFCPWATDVTRPTTSVVVAAGPGSLAAGAVRFAQGEAVWSLGFHLPDTSGDSGSVALTRASTSDGPRTIISDHIAGVEVSLTGVTVAGTCQIDGLHGDPFRLVVWRTRTGASFQLDAGSDVSVSGDIPAGQFALPPVVVPR